MKNIPLKAAKYDTTSPKYKKLTVDKLPIIKTFETLDYKQLLNEYKITLTLTLFQMNIVGLNK